MINEDSQDKILFNTISHRYSEKDEYLPSAIARREMLNAALCPILKKKKRFKTILELGCGSGASALYLSGQYDRYIGVDYSDQLIGIAKRKFSGYGNVQFFAYDINHLDRMDLDLNDLDLVLFVGVLHHMPEAADFLKYLRAHINPNTDFVFIEPNSSNPLIQLLRKIRMRFDKEYSAEQIQFSGPELKTILQDAGFREVAVNYQGIFSTPFAQVMLKPRTIFLPLSRICSAVDRILQRLIPARLRSFSWNLTVAAKN